MSWILLSNDDGVDSPALLPFADAVERALGLPVRVCVPDGERSWSSKAVTRSSTITATTVRRGERDVVAVSGTPADAVQLGMYGLFAEDFLAAPPRALITGINLGYNSGTGFMASSGTVWAAAEGALAGIPSVAFSTGPDPTGPDFASWRSASWQPEAAATWQRLAGVCADVLLDVSNSDLLDHGDLVSVNMPWGADLDTGRAVTQLTSAVYGPLFTPADEDGTWTFTRRLDLHLDESVEDGDIAALRRGEVSITPVLLPSSNRVPERTRTALER